MLEWIEKLMNDMGYLGIVLLMFLENIFPPIPSELIMPLAGFTAARGDLTFVGVVLAGTVGSVLGALPLYWLGRWVGEERLIKWADKHGKWLTLSGDDIRKADDWFDKHGRKTVFFLRLVPGVRSLISLPAGMSEMSVRLFLLFTALGTALWSALLTYLGYLLGDNYKEVEHYMKPVSYTVLGVLAIVVVRWFLIRRNEQARKEQKQTG
ncbi:DedA family protein [Deinococcus misasensis]|uniref:DedA family protein n=1 Tax=Deinococcus misasensis TaxID=392413 RepID=UPI00054E6F3C|nr:DedA family protein [Deinococcus misasensis]